MNEDSPHLQDAHKTAAAAAKSLQSCPTLCDPVDCSPPSSSVHGIFQARVLEWVPLPSSVVDITSSIIDLDAS